ncbi:hypothetical protein J6TS7_06160 [Paenibacillus dendritiformis]|nr:hypothetical protein J6TS7_06160 [Paenibacillus dendritiformis]
MLGEYASRGLYYQQANQVMPGICPEFFAYHGAGAYLTIESYCGSTLSLQETARADAAGLGRQCGQFMSAMSRAEAPLRGFGFLGWQEEGLAGEIQGDLQAYRQEETNEYLEQFGSFKPAFRFKKIHRTTALPVMRSTSSASTGPSLTDSPTAFLPAMPKKTRALNIPSRLRNF